MQLKNALLNSKNSNRGVSPVIGVILMVVITVILAGVVAVSFMGFGDQVDEGAPQASFDDDYDSQTLTLTHQNGDEIDASNLKLFVDGSEAKTFSGDISAGSQLTYDKGSSWNGENVRLVYDDGQGNTATLYSNDESPTYRLTTTYDTTTQFENLEYTAPASAGNYDLNGDTVYLDESVDSDDALYITEPSEINPAPATEITVEVSSVSTSVTLTATDSGPSEVDSVTATSAGTYTLSGTDIQSVDFMVNNGDGTATITSFTVKE